MGARGLTPPIPPHPLYPPRAMQFEMMWNLIHMWITLPIALRLPQQMRPIPNAIKNKLTRNIIGSQLQSAKKLSARSSSSHSSLRPCLTPLRKKTQYIITTPITIRTTPISTSFMVLFSFVPLSYHCTLVP